MSGDPEIPALDPVLAKELHAPAPWRTVGRAGVFLAVVSFSAGAAVLLHRNFPASLPAWCLSIPAYVAAAAALHGLSLFTHEAVHGTLCRDGKRNAFFGALCALPVMQNFSAYRVLHLRHHGHLGEAHDPDHYANYAEAPATLRAMNLLRLVAGYPVYVAAIPVLAFRHGDASDRAGIVAELALLAGLAFFVTRYVPGDVILHAWALPMIVVNLVTNVRGMSQHTLLREPDHPVRGTRSILTDRVTAFFMCNENYHLEHHLYPGIPWHALPRAHAALRDELAGRGALFIASYGAFVREFLKTLITRSGGDRGRS